jgi:hypothetical protein
VLVGIRVGEHRMDHRVQIADGAGRKSARGDVSDPCADVRRPDVTQLQLAELADVVDNERQNVQTKAPRVIECRCELARFPARDPLLGELAKRRLQREVVAADLVPNDDGTQMMFRQLATISLAVPSR